VERKEFSIGLGRAENARDQLDTSVTSGTHVATRRPTMSLERLAIERKDFA
jgi:hypothetical protein